MRNRANPPSSMSWHTAVKEVPDQDIVLRFGSVTLSPCWQAP